MSDEQKPKLRLEIGHVLFIDMVGYSKLLVDEQAEALEELNRVVRNTEAATEAQTAGQLIILPTGDGMALVFTGSVEDPVECAVQISQSLGAQPVLPLRMGIHSGPVQHLKDVNDRENIAGAGINIAQRVMDCGDAGHILISKRVADDLAQSRHWKSYLHELGKFEVKHGVVVSVVNLYAEGIGNPAPPQKLKRGGRAPAARPPPKPFLPAALAIVLLVAVAAGIFFFRHRSGEQGATPTHAPAGPVLDKSIAVLPFENLSSEKENAYFTDGVQDEVLTHLAKIADLKVISRTSVMQYKSGGHRNLRDIGQQLGVAHLVEGSVQRAANKVRVIAQLIDARTDAHLWAQTYDRDLADVFAIQSEIAQAIAEQLQARLSPAEKSAIEQPPTADIAAFELYSRAKPLIATAGIGAGVEKTIREGLEFLEAAVVRDPKFHAAFCSIAYGNDRLYAENYDHTPERLAGAEAALRNATGLRPESAETHLARANHLYLSVHDRQAAEAELEIARGGLPNDSRIPELRGYILRSEGKREEGLRLLEQALALNPRNLHLLQQISVSYNGARQYAREAELIDRALQIEPDYLAARVGRKALELVWHADADPLCRFVEQIRTTNPATVSDVADNWFECALARRDWPAAEEALANLGDNPSWSDHVLNFDRAFGEGLLARATGDAARARSAFTTARAAQQKIVQEQPDYAPALCILGLIDAALGNKDAALAEGRRAMELLPPEKDATNSEVLMAYFAVTAAWAGEKDLALQQLAKVIPLPGAVGITHYGVLKLLPFWDPLRSDPRFEQIVALLAPK